MKFVHLADLHLGKRVNEFSMLEEQSFILDRIMEILKEERPDGLLLSGDIYDKPTPSAEAVTLFDSFLSRLAEEKIETFLISGNHDSPERLAFAAELIVRSGIHVSPVYHGTVDPILMDRGAEKAAVFLLPFLKPAAVRRFFPEAEIGNESDAVRTALAAFPPTPGRKRILLAHQTVLGAAPSDSEEITVGGEGGVSAEVFAGFDYVALGHLHRPQKAGSDRIRYAGSPLKYSFSEADHEKSAAVIEWTGDEEIGVRFRELRPLHDLRKLRGTYREVTDRAVYDGPGREDYLLITLTDEEDGPDAAAKLRVFYPTLMKMEYDNRRTRAEQKLDGAEESPEKTPLELFRALYEKQNNAPMTEEQEAMLRPIMEKIWEDEL